MAKPPTSPNDLSNVLQRVLKCYTARSPSELFTLHTSTYATNAVFTDPFVCAKGQQEAMLQFYSLQKLFSNISVDLKSEPKIEPSSSGTAHKITVECALAYTWQEGLMKRLMADTTPVECTVIVEVSDATNEVIDHTDIWTQPSVPNLPMFLRTLNCTLTNTVFRLLGWEKELHDGKSD